MYPTLCFLYEAGALRKRNHSLQLASDQVETVEMGIVPIMVTMRCMFFTDNCSFLYDCFAEPKASSILLSPVSIAYRLEGFCGSTSNVGGLGILGKNVIWGL